MEEEFLLKYHGNYSKFELAYMTAEERKWNIDRINKEKTREAESAKSNQAMPATPKIPPPHR
jgi:hypothetical protein